mmetsp:Transcript_14599/g.17786  ORF Transcript_14599/g.17786 Transcript_14599/m.17786 type:complete len:282 (-) Transcript_14599:344-1189(-)
MPGLNSSYEAIPVLRSQLVPVNIANDNENSNNEKGSENDCCQTIPDVINNNVVPDERLLRQSFKRAVSEFSLGDVCMQEQLELLGQIEQQEEAPELSQTIEEQHHAPSSELTHREMFRNMSSHFRLSGINVHEQQDILQTVQGQFSSESSCEEDLLYRNLILSEQQQQEELFQSIQQQAQETPEQNTIEIYPGHVAPLYDEDVTNDALWRKKDVTIVDCQHCMDSGGARPGVVMSTRLHCVTYASMVLCPKCFELSSVPRPNVRVIDEPLNESVCVGVLVR